MAILTKHSNHLSSFFTIVFIFFCAYTPTVISQEISSHERKAHQAYSNKQFDIAVQELHKALNEYTQEQNIQSEFRMYMELGKTYMHQFKIDSAKVYYSNARSIAKKNKLNSEYGQALNSLSSIYQYLGMKDSTFYVCHEILKLPNLEHQYISDAYSTLGTLHEFRFEFDQAEQNILKAIEIDSIYQDSSSLPFNLTTYARLQTRKLKNEDALNYLMKAMNYLRDDRDKFKYATIYREISAVFYGMNNIVKSKEYAEKALNICRELNLKTTKIDALIYLALNEEREGNFEKALKYYFEAEEISVDKERIISTISINLGMAECYLSLGQFDLVQSRLDASKNLMQNLDQNTLLLRYNYLRSKLAIKNKNPKATSLALKTLNDAKKSNNIYLVKNLYQLLAEDYENQNQLSSALSYYKNYNNLKDSIYSMQQNMLTQELEARYIKKEQENQIDLLAAENDLKSIRLKQQSLFLWGTLLALLGFLALLFVIIRFNKKLKKQKEIAEKSLNDKNVLLREIHHRVKNNLQIISSLLALQSKYIQDDNALIALQQGQDRVHSMALIHEDLYRSENLTGVDTEIYFEQLIDNLFESYNIHEERVQLNMEVEPLSLDVDSMIPLGLILNELVSNSLKHAFKDNDKGIIEVKLKEVGNELHLTVKDNGKQIKSQEDIDGKSFGYELVKAFARKLKATIDFDTKKGLQITLKIKQYQKA